MANIIGTIVNLNDFLCSDEKQVTISGNDESTAFILSKDRQYSIPSFQREIRWSIENLNILIQDIKSSNKFLGNVILSKKNSMNFEIIDGQQRITVLLMILHYLKKNHGEQIDEAKNFKACDLIIDSFTAYKKLQDAYYDLSALSQEDLDTDKYKQAGRYKALWDSLDKIDALKNSNEVRELFTNLKRSYFNVILANRDTTDYKIDYFIDVNLKGVKLDTEDIFKGYLFYMNNSEETLKSWVCLKQKAIAYNKIAYADEETYPLTKMLYHYFISNLYSDNRCIGASFGTDFYLKENFESGGKNFYKGEHIIKVINDDAYMSKSLKNLAGIIDIFTEIIDGEEPTRKFKSRFINSGNGKVDDDTIVIIKGLARLILLDKEVTLPYALVMKYFLEIMKGSIKKIDHDYAEKFYTIYAFSVFFGLFSTRKEIKQIESVLQDVNWYERLKEKISEYFINEMLTTHSVVAQYKYVLDDNNIVYKYKCKSLALLYNYFKIKDGKVSKLKGKSNELKKYLTDKDEFSVEHLIINDGKGCSLENVDTVYEYPKDIKRYANSIFNYIFIPDELNGNLLKNLYVNSKLELLNKNSDKIKCSYSKMVIKTLCDNKFKELPLTDDGKSIDAEKANAYFGYEFKNQFLKIASEIIKKTIEQMEKE